MELLSDVPDSFTKAARVSEKRAQGVNAMRTPGEPKVKVDFAVITFDQITDTAERQRFNAMPTTYRLGPEQVDALRALAGRLLEQSPEFRSFLRAMQRDEP